MPIDYSLLEKIHGKLREITDLNQQLKRCPRLMNQAQTAERDAQSHLVQAREELTRAKLLSHEKQLQMKQREASIKTHEGQRNACESNREYQILTEQIAADLKANEVLADEILELLERIDELEINQKTAQEQRAAAKENTSRTAETVAAKTTVLQKQLAIAATELKQLASTLPGNVAVEYQRLVASRGDETLAETSGQDCGNCNTVLTVQTKAELYQQMFVTCQNCGSILYLNQQSLMERAN